MKVVAFTALHYGLDYLPYAIRSVAPFVDEWLVAYSPVGSHGSRSRVVCPEGEGLLRRATEQALAASGNKPLQWWRGMWSVEGAQRDSVFERTDADLVLVVDADEVWQDGAAQEAIERAASIDAWSIRVPFIHFWRSFSWCCHDNAWPVRMIKPGYSGEAYADIKPVLHFGYARKPDAIEYKMRVHGHRGEWRNDWFIDRFMRWTPQGPHEDLHPTNMDFWTAEPYAREQLPDLLHSHPYYAMEVIE